MADLSTISDSDLASMTGMQPPAASPSSGADSPLSMQNNNPGNMKQNGALASYDSPKAGLAAMQHDLTVKVSGHSPMMKSQYGDGYQPTLRNVISTWAPPSENDTKNYIDFVSKHSGIDPDRPLTAQDVPAIMQPMIHMEGGQKASSYFGKLMQGIGDAVISPAQASDTDQTAVPAPAATTQQQPSADLSHISDEELASLTGMKPQPSGVENAYEPFKPIVNNTLENLKNAATGTGEAMSEPMNNPAVSDWSKHPVMGPLDAAVRGVGKIGNAVGGTMEAAFSPVTGAATAAVEPMIPAISRGIKSLVADDPRFKSLDPGAQTHTVAQGIGNDIGTAVGLGMAANQGAASLRQQQGLPPATPPSNPLQPVIDKAKSLASEPANTSSSLLRNNSGAASMLPPLAKEAPILLKTDEPTAPGAAPSAPLLVSPKAVENAPGKLQDYLEADGIDLNKTADHLEALQKVDPNARAIDAITQGEGDIRGGANVNGLLKSISQTPGQARTMVAQMISRGKNAASDIGDWVSKSLGAGDYATSKQQLADGMKASGTAYEKAYANPVPMSSPAINDLLARPAGQKALASAKNLAANEGASITNLDGSLNTQGIDYVKRALDDMVSGEGTTQFGKVTQAGRGYLEIKNGLLQEADNLNPDFKAARAQFADPASQMAALEQGRNFFSMSKHDIADFMAGKTPAEKAQFANGVSEAMSTKVGSVNDGTNPINKVWNSNMRAKFRPMFPDEPSYEKFAQGMDLHQVKMGVNQVMSGSPTFQNQAFDTQPVKTVTGHAIRLASDPLAAAGNMVGSIADKVLAKNAAKLDGDSKVMITRILTTKDPAALRAVAARIKSKQP